MVDNYSVFTDESTEGIRRMNWGRVGNLVCCLVLVLLCLLIFFTPGYFVGLLILGEDWRHPDAGNVVGGWLIWGCIVIGFIVLLVIIYESTKAIYLYVYPVVSSPAVSSAVSNSDESTVTNSNTPTPQEV